MTPPINPGFIALHGNRSEDLAQAVIAWLEQHPLSPLEEEVILVQSNGMAEWFKMEMARRSGVCSAVRVELPGRFLWRTYRQVLGPGAVPRESPLDKLPMTWRLMQVLPTVLDADGFAPLKRYLMQQGHQAEAQPQGQDAAQRHLQLANQLADLYDQYQNYRADWLEDWTAGRDQLLQAKGLRVDLPEEQKWQAQLWRAVLSTLTDAQRNATRPRLHRLAMERLQSQGDVPQGRVARRVVAFGMSHMPGSTLEALSALSRHSQVMLAVPNPCRFYWGDIMDGRELLHTLRRRQPHKHGTDLSLVAMEDMHLHAHPLLAAWGRQGRDFVRQLDAFDDAQLTRHHFPHARIDLFDESPEDANTPLLNRIQNRIRDLEPLGANPPGLAAPLDAADRSVVFQVAHSRVRELEVLHDHLLDLLAAPAGAQPKLHARDIVVMVPDIELMAPAIRAVFGQYPRHDKRHIPFDIADLSAKVSSPMVAALEWLLRLDAQRCQLSELLDVLQVPAVSQRFGVSADQLPLLSRWMAGAGIRWGLNLAQREQLGLDACGEQNSAWFGLRRMLLGYAAGSLEALPHNQGWHSIEPYSEIGGLDAELAGSFAHLLQALTDWWQLAQTDATPADWCERGRHLLQAMFKPTDEVDSKVMAALNEALTDWLAACEQAGFQQKLGLSAMRRSWLEALDAPGLDKRFRAGGVTFCTLMPLRAIPFEVVALLGMNDGDYPRRSQRNDFDLMALPGQQRPGDRSRQQDDRQLMLEALLSARRALYISWTGRNVRDNSEQAPSVLVSQLRDYMGAMWGDEAVRQRTTEHPLQPFSRSYFESDGGLHTHAREWRRLHEGAGTQSSSVLQTWGFEPGQAALLTLDRLAAFYRNPAKAFFNERLNVRFNPLEEEAPDVEAFSVEGLEHHALVQSMLAGWWPAHSNGNDLLAGIPQGLDRLQREGKLPMGAVGLAEKARLHGVLKQMAQAWQAARQQYPTAAPRLRVEFHGNGCAIHDWVDKLYTDGHHTAWLELTATKLFQGKKVRPDKMLPYWLRSLAAAAAQPCGLPPQGWVVGQNAHLRIKPMDPEAAVQQLQQLLAVWQLGMSSPLPLPLVTAIKCLGKSGNPMDAYQGSEFQKVPGEVNDMYWARCYPDFETLWAARTSDGRSMKDLAQILYQPLLDWINTHVEAFLFDGDAAATEEGGE